jgi:hypothetical protein
MEIKINSKGELVFIEVGPRLNGGEAHKLVKATRADGNSQMEYAVDAALGLPGPDSHYETGKEGVRVFAISKGEGCLKKWTRLDEITSLRSFSEMHLNAEVGQHISRTTDLSNNIGWFDLVNADRSALREDEERLDAILDEGVLVFESR